MKTATPANPDQNAKSVPPGGSALGALFGLLVATVRTLTCLLLAPATLATTCVKREQFIALRHKLEEVTHLKCWLESRRVMFGE